MSFVQKQWKDRQSTYPTRRNLTDTTTGTVQTVTVARNEGTVTQEGDVFNASNMNNLEQRIADAFASVSVAGGGVRHSNISSADDTVINATDAIVNQQVNPQDTLNDGDIIVVTATEDMSMASGVTAWTMTYVTKNSSGTPTTSDAKAVVTSDASFTDDINKGDALILKCSISDSIVSFVVYGHVRNYVAGDGINIGAGNTIENDLPTAFIGKSNTTSASSKSDGTVTTDIAIERDLQVGDRILVNLANDIYGKADSGNYETDLRFIVTYRGGVAVSTPVMIPPYIVMPIITEQPVRYKKGYHLFQLQQVYDIMQEQYVKRWSHVNSFEQLLAGDGIQIQSNKIINIKPQNGENIADIKYDTAVTDGALGDVTNLDCDYAILRFAQGAQPDSNGRYRLTTVSSYGSISYYTLYKMNEALYSDEIAEGTSLLIKIKDSGYDSSLQGYKARVIMVSSISSIGAPEWIADPNDDEGVIYSV